MSSRNKPPTVGPQFVYVVCQVGAETVCKTELLSNILTLQAVKGFGPMKFKGAFESNISFEELLRNPSKLNLRGKSGLKLEHEFRSITSDVVARIIVFP